MLRGTRSIVALSVLLAVLGAPEFTVLAETLAEKDGIELSGRVRRVARGVGRCQVQEESHPEEVYERIKANHGQPLDVWRLDYSVYNGSGKPLSSLSSHFQIESEWPPCTNWSGPEGSYSKPVQWTGSFQVLQKPYGMGPGEEVSDTVFVLAFHEHRPRFESWDVNYRFGKLMGAPAGAGSAVPEAVRRAAPGADVREVQRVQPKARERLPFEPEMVVIPGGRFRMGCLTGRDCSSVEQPVHEVRVESFELGKYEVTFEEYDRFKAATGRERANDRGGGRGRRPVVNVSWEDAVAYTKWLSGQTGERYRLPSEAEWEYAARAGTETKYHFGKEKSELCLYGNHADRSTNIEWRNQTCSDGVGRQTALVGTYQPNGFGLYDMHGNVLEWVQDCGNLSYQGAPTNGSAWESGDCSTRVLRGGSWRDDPWELRSAYRLRSIPPSGRLSLVGFRVARTITP